jgi:hypothetical protein
MGCWQDAVTHFEAAIRIHERMNALPLLVRSRHYHGKALVAGGRPDDRRRGQEHLDWAAAVARRLGMHRFPPGIDS